MLVVLGKFINKLNTCKIDMIDKDIVSDKADILNVLDTDDLSITRVEQTTFERYLSKYDLQVPYRLDAFGTPHRVWLQPPLCSYPFNNISAFSVIRNAPRHLKAKYKTLGIPLRVDTDFTYGCKGDTGFAFTEFDSFLISNCAYMFAGCVLLKTVDLTGIVPVCANWEKPRSTVSLEGMFSDCVSLREIKFGGVVNTFVNNISGMFKGCSRLRELDLSSFDTRHIRFMDDVFKGCDNLRLVKIKKGSRLRDIIPSGVKIVDCF